ncbi:hypothetical protein ACHAPT_000311 [Fusarium lateritium]
MTTTATEARARPPIEPIRTTGPDLTARAFRARMVLKSPTWSASPLSPRSLPLPGCQELRDEQMRQHDKMAVDRLELRGRDSSNLEPSLRNVSLRPIAELALPTPSTLPARRSPLSAPLFAPPVYRRPTIVEETRNMLLHEPDGEQEGNPVLEYERRQSAPSGVLHARAMQIARQREHLRRRGFVGSYRPREAELLVMPVELRRLSITDLEYARTYLPVLAAIILSEIVRPGDTIELPLPHPRAWEDTVAYIYTGRVALTEPIRQNIVYLGGKV